MPTINRVQDFKALEILTEADLDSEFNRIHDLLNGKLDGANISNNSLDLESLAQNKSVSTAKIKDSAVTPDKIDITKDLDFGSHKATNLADGSAGDDAATVSQLSSTVTFIDPVNILTNSNHTFNQTIDVSAEVESGSSYAYISATMYTKNAANRIDSILFCSNDGKDPTNRWSPWSLCQIQEHRDDAVHSASGRIWVPIGNNQTIRLKRITGSYDNNNGNEDSEVRAWILGYQ